MKALVNAFEKIFQTFLIGLFFFFIFAIIGISIFKGRMFRCDISNVSKAAGNVDSVYDCMNLGGEWIRPDVNFDHIFIAILTLFEMFTCDSWRGLSDDLSDTLGVDLNPRLNATVAAPVFVVLFIVIGALIIRNIFTGIVSDTFSKQKSLIEGNSAFTTLQKRWIRQYKQIFKASPLRGVPYTLTL
jgi:hypothetical protein